MRTRSAWFSAIAAGAALGVVSRVEEVTAGFSLGISTNGTWLALAFALGLLRLGSRRGAAAVGAVALTVANAAYYAWVAATEPGVELASVAGSPPAWLALGLGGGAVFGVAGWVAAKGPAPARVLAALLLAGVLLVDGASALRDGPTTDGLGLLAGLALPAVMPVRRELRVLGTAAAVVVAAVAATGALDALSP